MAGTKKARLIRAGPSCRLCVGCCAQLPSYDVEQALRILKRKMQREGVVREMPCRRFYEKPSDRASREKAEAIRRLRRFVRKTRHSRRTDRRSGGDACRQQQEPDRIAHQCS